MFTGPQIVTNGLILLLDAGNTKSYPTTGTTWYNRIGNNNNGILVNNPTFNSSNGGNIIFDGVDDYVTFSTVSVQTICFWGRMNPTITGLAGLVCSGPTTDGSLRTESGSFRAVSPNPPNADDFHNGFVSSFMINGVSNLSTNASGNFIIPNSRTLTQDFYVGAIGNSRNLSSISQTFNGRLYKGLVYSVCLYNRQLTNSELLQNYNATKSRFGL